MIGSAVNLLSRNWATFGALAFALAFMPVFLFALFRMTGVLASSGNDLAAALRGAPGENAVVNILGLLLQASLIHACLVDLKGGRPDWRESLKAASRYLLPLIGIGMIAGLATFLGLLLLILPGVLLYLRWLIAPAVAVAERKGVLESMGRSAALTRDNRWRLFGLALIGWLVATVMVAVVAVPYALLPEGSKTALVLSDLILGPLVSLIAALITGVGLATVYADLRRVKGSPVADVAAVFG